MAGIYKPSTFEYAYTKAPPCQFSHASYFSTPFIFACHSESFDDVCKMPM
jgi:hypothetical protein